VPRGQDGVHSKAANISLLGWRDGTAALIRKSPPSSGHPPRAIGEVVVWTRSANAARHDVDDPVEILMSVQLGGGTDIAQAVRYCGQLVENPHRTVLVLVTDFCEGAPPGELVRAVKALAEARVKLLGLASLDGRAQPMYDRAMAERLAACGMEIAALTPQRLAHWLVKVVS
jgi:Mg-chelatase subunit ChlD